jgi:hypothetical protein
VLLEKVSKTEGAIKKRNDLSSRSPPVVSVWDRRPVPSHDAQSQNDWEKRNEYRDYSAFDSAAKNKTLMSWDRCIAH